MRPRVVIVGGGFGGLACARKLDGGPADVVLIDRRNYHLFTPLLYQVATGLLNPGEIAYPLRKVFRHSPNVRFRQAGVAAVDFEEKRVRLHDGFELPYDSLVLATGSGNDYFGNRALAKHALGMKSLEEAMRLRNHVLACLEHATHAPQPEERRRWLTFVVVGGGPTGVEYSGAIDELLRLVLGRDYPGLARHDARVVLVEGKDRLLATFREPLGRYARRILEERGVEVRCGVLVGEAGDDRATLSDGTEIECRTIVWSAGVRAHDPTGGAALDRTGLGRLVVDGHLRVPGREGVFAIGDVAAARQRGDELPMLSPVAMQAGRYVARRILEEAGGGRGATTRAFRYVDKGTMATIGRSAAVADVHGVSLKGFVGWVVWLTVHLYYLIGFRNRIVALGSWAWDYVRKDRPIRIIVQAEEDRIAEELEGAEPAPGPGRTHGRNAAAATGDRATSRRRRNAP